MSSDFLDNVAVDITLLSRWDVSLNFKDDMIDSEGATDSGIKALRKQCRTLLIKLLTTVQYCLTNKLTFPKILEHCLGTRYIFEFSLLCRVIK